MDKIEWQRKAVKQLRKFPQKNQKQITDAVGGLEDFADNRFVKKLVSHQYDFRLTVGRYRVLFNHQKTIEIVSIEEVKKRDDRTY